MPKEQRMEDRTPFLRLEPERRLCPVYEADELAADWTAEQEETGFRDLDDFCQEHIQ